MSNDKEGSCNTSAKEEMQNKTACDSHKSDEKTKQVIEEEKRKAEQVSVQPGKKDGGCCAH